MGPNAENWTNIPERARGLRAVSHKGEGANAAEEKSCQRSFLNHVFSNIPLFEVENFDKKMFTQSPGKGIVEWTYGDGITINASENIETLAKTAEAYCRINGGVLSWKKTNNPLRDLQTLYMQMLRCKPEANELSIDYNCRTNTLDFLEYTEVQFNYYTVFMLTIEFIDHIPDEYKEAMYRFLTYLYNNENFGWYEDSMDLTYALGMWMDDTDDEAEESELAELRKNYLHGHISECIHKVIDGELIKSDELTMMLDEVIKKCPIENVCSLFEIAKEGVELMSKDSLRCYRRNPNDSAIPDFTNDEDGEYLDFERLFIVCWGDVEEDMVSSMALDCINGESQQLSQEMLYDFRVLTPDTNTQLLPSEYPMKWSKWFDKFISETSEYEHLFREDV